MRMLFTEEATRTGIRAFISKPPPVRPYLYRALRRVKSAYSRQGSDSQEELQKLFRRNPQLFAMDESTTRQLESLVARGYAFAPRLFSKELVDHIHAKADVFFRGMETSPPQAHEAPRQQRTKPGACSVSYPAHAEHAAHALELPDPLVHASEVLDIAFHESILKMAAHFFGHIPSIYRVGVSRYFPCGGTPHPGRFRQETNDLDSLEILIDLADVDDSRGPLVYVPGSHRYGSCRPRLLSAFGLPVEPRRLEDKEVETIYPRKTWAKLSGERGSITAIHNRGLTKGPVWPNPGGTSNKARTVIRIYITGRSQSSRYDWDGNLIRKWNFDRMSLFQQAFTHAVFFEEQMLA
jgi:hypothetical protein